MIDYNIIATGSKGNAVVIDQKILIDCGVSFKALSKVYRALKLVLLTHIHSDHFQPTTLRLLAENRPTLRFACCAWLCKPLVDAGVPVSQIDVLEPGHMYGYGICNVRPDMVKHNVPNCAWKVWLPSGKLFYCTDISVNSCGGGLVAAVAELQQHQQQQLLLRGFVVGVVGL